MNRRDFLKGTGGSLSALAAMGISQAESDAESQQTTTQTTTGSGNQTATQTTTKPTGEETVTVEVGPNGSNKFVPEQVYITPGTTVKWVWKSAGHNIVVGSQPDAANWQGTPGGPGKLYNPPYTYTHTFTVKGKYHYWCQPHKALGMVGDVIVNESGQPPGGAAKGGGGEIHPEEMGVPFRAHWVGVATILMMFVSLIYTFFVLKYGESPNASSPNRE